MGFKVRVRGLPFLITHRMPSSFGLAIVGVRILLMSSQVAESIGLNVVICAPPRPSRGTAAMIAHEHPPFDPQAIVYSERRQDSTGNQRATSAFAGSRTIRQGTFGSTFGSAPHVANRAGRP